MFRDRIDAGQQLGRRVSALLRELSGVHAPLVLGLPRGGVVVAAEIARALRAPLDVLVVRKVGAPWQPELAVGAVADVEGRAEVALDHNTIVALGIDEEYVRNTAAAEHAEAVRRLSAYRGNRPPLAVAGRVVIVVDDGIATGATMRLASQILRRGHPHRLVLAVPVAPPDVLESLARDADEVVCLASPPQFASVGAHYHRFDQTTDEEVIAILAGPLD